VEVADGGAETEDAWGVRACDGIARLSGSLEGLTAMIGRQNDLLGRLVEMMETERMWASWRWRREGSPRVTPVRASALVLGEGDDGGDEEVGNGVEEKGNEEEEVRDE
jgi:hypothetical protein